MSNRAQRRALMRDKGHFYARMGFSKDQLKQMAVDAKAEHLKEGDKVQLDYEFCIRQKQFKEQDDAFKKFVEDNQNTIFTVKHDPKRKEANSSDVETMVMFEEDPNGYLFDSCTVKIIERKEKATATIKNEDGTEQKVDLGDVTDPNDPSIMQKVNEALT